jgi:hypothetical protein
MSLLESMITPTIRNLLSRFLVGHFNSGYMLRRKVSTSHGSRGSTCRGSPVIAELLFGVLTFRTRSSQQPLLFHFSATK